MDAQIDRLVKKLQDRVATIPPKERLLIAIAGIPGSGKTTLAARVVGRLNAAHSSSPSIDKDAPPLAAFVPADGYHLSRAQLSALPNPTEAHARRGAEFTFDGASYLALVRSVRFQSPGSATLYAPSFDHALKDPKYDAIPILASTRIIVFEGLYLGLNKDPWRAAGLLMDENWFVEVDFEVARKRLAERHVKSGICETLEEGDRRARENDLRNGEEIVRERIEMDRISEVVVSIADKSWSPETQDF